MNERSCPSLITSRRPLSSPLFVMPVCLTFTRFNARRIMSDHGPVPRMPASSVCAPMRLAASSTAKLPFTDLAMLSAFMNEPGAGNSGTLIMESTHTCPSEITVGSWSRFAWIE